MSINKRSQMLRTLVLVIIAILIFVPILNGAMKLLGIQQEQASDSFSNLVEKLNRLTGDNGEEGTETHAQKLAEKSGVFLFKKNVKRTTMVSISKRKSEVTFPVITSIVKPEHDSCEATDCICLCTSGLDYQLYKYNSIDYGLKKAQSLKPPLNFDLSMHSGKDRWQLFELSCIEWSCRSISGSQSNPLSVVNKTSINDSDFVDHDKYVRLEEYFINGFMVFYQPQIEKEVHKYPFYTQPPIRQKPYPYDKPEEPVIVFERVKDQLAACYHAPCFSEDQKMRIRHGKNYESIKSFNELSIANNNCLQNPKPTDPQEVKVKTQNEIYMYLTVSQGKPQDLFLQDESDPENPQRVSSIDSKICEDSKELQKVQEHTFSIHYVNNMCCIKSS